MIYKQRLELDWIGKDKELRLEPRILIQNDEYSNEEGESGNILIHGDNLLGLKALESKFSNKIKCVYIDPPYNTKQALDHYDDNMEHSIWLSMMKPRLEVLRNLLCEDGVLFVQINDDEAAYLKVLLDEIFGRTNFINQVSIKTKHTSGASGGGEDKKLKKNVEYILIYAKNNDTQNGFKKFNEVYEEKSLFKHIEKMLEDGKSWKYTRVITKFGNRKFVKAITDGSGEEIKIYKHEGFEFKTLKDLAKCIDANRKGLNIRDKELQEAYRKHFDGIFRDTNAQSSIRSRVMEAVPDEEGLVSIDYVPRSGRYKGKLTTVYYKGRNKDQIAWLSDIATKIKKKVVIREKLGTFWEGFNWNNVSKEGGVVFPNGKKPEALIQRIIELCTKTGDYVLDSFAGSGTTGAAAHKLSRKWIMIEMGKHCFTHIVPRLRKIISGEDNGGITDDVGWKGGGGFSFYELAPSLLLKDEKGNWLINKNYDAQQLAEAVCKHEKFNFYPDETVYWKQGFSSEKDFIFVTTQFLTSEHLDRISSQMKKDESLLICAKAFRIKKDKYPNITLKKIPQALLGRCEFGRDDYSLNIKESSQVEFNIDVDVEI